MFERSKVRLIDYMIVGIFDDSLQDLSCFGFECSLHTVFVTVQQTLHCGILVKIRWELLCDLSGNTITNGSTDLIFHSLLQPIKTLFRILHLTLNLIPNSDLNPETTDK